RHLCRVRTVVWSLSLHDALPICGDAITGVVRQPREGEQQRQKFNPLVRVDSVNGLEPETSKKRSEFTKLTPLYPNERLRLETDRSEEHTSELQSRFDLVCRLLLE